MAGSSASSDSTATVVLQSITEKLARNNHTTWRAQVVTTLRGARLEGLIIGRKKAPPAEIKEKDGDNEILVANLDYEDWLAADQQVLSFIFASVTNEILVRVAAAKMAVDLGSCSSGKDDGQCLEDPGGATCFSNQGTHSQCAYGTRHYSQGKLVGSRIPCQDARPRQ
jgi:hypothetical protein